MLLEPDRRTHRRAAADSAPPATDSRVAPGCSGSRRRLLLRQAAAPRRPQLPRRLVRLATPTELRWPPCLPGSRIAGRHRGDLEGDRGRLVEAGEALRGRARRATPFEGCMAGLPRRQRVHGVPLPGTDLHDQRSCRYRGADSPGRGEPVLPRVLESRVRAPRAAHSGGGTRRVSARLRRSWRRGP